MITNTGKQIIGKYLIGHTDSYASYLAIGCGPKPLSLPTAFGDYSTKTSLDFETLRVPIVSKSLLTDSVTGLTRVTLTAELPTEERYEITEVGVYPSEVNPIPTGLDSQPILLFNADELWQSHVASADLPIETGVIFNSNDDITITSKAFFTNSNNALFENINYPDRLERYERPRFLDRTIFVRGDSSVLAVNGTDLSVTSGDHLHLPIEPIIFDKNSTNDELRLAFTVINKEGISNTDTVSNVKILIQFATTDGDTPDYASFVVNLDNGTSPGQWDFPNNRYVVVNKKLSELYKTTNFAWDKVTFVKVYVCVTGNSPATAGDFYVALDALRLENISSFSDVYGLTAYTVMKTSDSLPIVKSDNSSSFIEFSYVVDVL